MKMLQDCLRFFELASLHSRCKAPPNHHSVRMGKSLVVKTQGSTKPGKPIGGNSCVGDSNINSLTQQVFCQRAQEEFRLGLLFAAFFGSAILLAGGGRLVA